MASISLRTLLLSSLLGSAPFTAAQLQDSFDGFTVNRLAVDVKPGAPAELKVVDNTVSLRRGNGTSTSAVLVEAMRKGKDVQGMYSRLSYGTTKLINVQGGSIFLADATIGGRRYSMVIDTGSSDPWLVRNNFVCLDVSSQTEILPEYCYFGPQYDPKASTTYSPYPDTNFNISYADGEFLNGVMGYERFTMAGITVPRQEFGMVDHAAWYGDTLSSGLMGFAYRTLTNAYPDTGQPSSVRGNPALYNPLFVNMYQQGLIAPVFALAISRDPAEGGILALGGLPNVPRSPTFVSTPIKTVGINATDGTLVYEFYTITIDGFAFSRNRFENFGPESSTNPNRKPVVGAGTNVIVDSGTTLLYAPTSVAEQVAALYDPPGSFDPTYQIYFVDCDAVAPTFGVMINGKIFFVNVMDLTLQIAPGSCIAGVQPSLGGLVILGDVFMKNVLAVFDLGAQQLSFSARTSYPLSWDVRRPRAESR